MADSATTSSDRLSHRPTKRRALTPNSSQAASVDALFAKPDQDIRLPPTATELAARAAASRHQPPEIVTNVQGSSAGAGSGEFHVYKASRRREYDRLAAMEEETRKEKEGSEFERQREERLRADEERTRRKREKRMKKMKGRKGKGGDDGEGEEKDGEKTKVGGIKANVVVRREAEEEVDGGSKETREADREAADKPSVAKSEPSGLLIVDED